MPLRRPAGFISAFYDPLNNPNAPTIGTATAGSGSASVTFTAPANMGGGAITGFTVVSTPDGITGTGASSPITVSGLTGGTAYTFKVFATNAFGPSPLSAASNSVTPIPVIGAAFGGGFFAGQIGVSSVATHNLIAGPLSTAQTSSSWKSANTATPGADSAIDGPQNTADMVADGDATVYIGAHFCNNLVIGGFSDWYMPARYELDICYYNLKPTVQSNGTSSGINPNAVPARASNYTTGTPAQTSATAFQSGGTEAFSSSTYWSSSDLSTTYARLQYFSTGYQVGYFKTTIRNIRAVRRVPV